MAIGVIGCGRRMKKVLNWLLEVNSNHMIASVYDTNEKAMEDYKREFGEHIKICESYQEVTSDPSVDWIFIGSINKFHKEQIISAFNSGKNVFSEKPLAISIDECKEIKNAYCSRNLKFLISYPLRYSPHYQKIKEIIDKGKIGSIVSIEFNDTLPFNHGAFIMSDWRRYEDLSGGHFLEKCCHDIDIVNWITNSVVRKVCSFGGLNFFTEENDSLIEELDAEKKDFKRNLTWSSDPFISEKDIIDNQVVILEYGNGVRATFHTNCSTGIPERRIYICGTKGTIRADALNGKIECKGIKPSDEYINIISGKFDGSHGGGDLPLAREIDRAIIQNEFQGNSFDDALKSAATSIAIDISRKENKILDLTSIWNDLDIH